MVYILNTEIPDKKPVSIGFQKIFGIGEKKINRIKKKIGLTSNIRVSQLNADYLNKISNLIENEYEFGNDLRQQLIKNNENLIKKNCYRGIRSNLKLPRRGQRTHTNAKTAKKRKI